MSIAAAKVDEGVELYASCPHPTLVDERRSRASGTSRGERRSSGWLSRARWCGGARMGFEEIPDYVGCVQIVAGSADPFFGEAILSAWPYVTEAFDRVIDDLAAFCALIVCDFIDAVARARRGDLRTAPEHPFPFLQRIVYRRMILR